MFDTNILRPVIEKTSTPSSHPICFFKTIKFMKKKIVACVLMTIITITSSLDDYPPMCHRITEQGGKDGD